MDIAKLNFIRQDVLKVPLEEKERSEEFVGVMLHSNSPVTLQSYQPPIHAFRAFSQKNYLIYFFISNDAISEDYLRLVSNYRNIKTVIIPRLQDIYAFNNFSINNLLYLIDQKHENLVYFQDDGFCIAPGWEEKTKGYSWLGAPWKEPIEVLQSTFMDFKPIQIGNGGANFRRRSKCLQVLDLINEYGGQKLIVKGIKIDNKIKHNNPFVAEDALFCYFGFNSGIFEPVELDFALSFSREPISMQEYLLHPRPACFFHRIDY